MGASVDVRSIASRYADLSYQYPFFGVAALNSILFRRIDALQKAFLLLIA